MNANEIIDKWLQTHRTNPSSSTTEAATANQTLLANPWIACHLDLASPGTTQAYTFASWEIDSSSSSPTTLHAQLLTTLFLKIHSSLIPNLPLSPPETWLWLRDNGKWLSQPYSRAKVLFGSFHESVRGLVEEKATSRRDGWYDKWIIPGSASTSTAEAGSSTETPHHHLPAGYALATLQDHELQSILDGSPIPRTLAYLKQVANAGVYFTDTADATTHPDLVGYGFLNKDASLGGLLVHEAHQGKGLATALARRLFALQEENFSLAWTDETAGVREEKGAWLASSDVGEGNGPSRRVMEKLGGRRMWRVCWAEVDLDVVAGIKEKYE